jgi:hypothetical protein
MSKRRVASTLMFGKKDALKYPVKVVARTSGTGTEAAYGIVTMSLATTGIMTGGQVYLTVSSGTNIGTLVGTAR